MRYFSSRLSFLLSAFINAFLGSIFEMKAVPVPVRATWKPRGYGRPVSEILYARRR
jgi:hypothetical protein